MYVRVTFSQGGKGPIANAPGLYFDLSARRWKRADTSVPGTYFDPSTRRWKRTPHQSPPDADADTRDFHQWANDEDRKEIEPRNRVADAYHDQGIKEFKNPNGGGHAVILRDASEPGRWRYSRYDAGGFSGHTTFDTEDGALAGAAMAGYHEPAHGSLGAFFGTDEWNQGTRDAKVMQTVNSIPTAAGSAVLDYYHRNGRTDEAHDMIHKREHVDALQAGNVPEALKAVVVDRVLVERMKSVQMDLFGDPSHGGTLHQEQRVNQDGTSQRRWVKSSLHQQFGPDGAPKPGERGHRVVAKTRLQAEARARGIYDAAKALIRGELGQHVFDQMRRIWGEPTADGSSWDDYEMDVVAPDDLPALIGWSSLSPEDAADVIDLVMQSTDPGGFGPPRGIAEGIIADQFAPAGKMRLVNVPLDEAIDFIAEHHSEMPIANPRGLMYAIGIKRGSRLVAVATAGTPTGRWANPHQVLELTRIASDGTTKGASSKLAARVIDLAPRSVRGGAPGDPWLFVTYSLTSESGTTYRALREKGLRPVKIVRGKKSGGGGARAASQTGYATPDKIRWEAGPMASPAQWDLIKKRGRR